MGFLSGLFGGGGSSNTTVTTTQNTTEIGVGVEFNPVTNVSVPVSNTINLDLSPLERALGKFSDAEAAGHENTSQVIRAVGDSLASVALAKLAVEKQATDDALAWLKKAALAGAALWVFTVAVRA